MNLFSNLLFRFDVRRLSEDTLKAIYSLEEDGLPVNADRLAALTGLKISNQQYILDLLHKQGYCLPPDSHLTESGRKYALKVIRRHRLLEKYLSEHSGYEPNEWHTQACKEEHYLSDEEQERIAVRLGNPLFDPHGDPIPTEEGEVQSVEGVHADELPDDSYVRVIHIEDEPADLYRQIETIGFFRGAVFHLLRTDTDGVHLSFEGEQFLLPQEAAHNLTVMPCTDKSMIDLAQKTVKLTTLRQGEEATIAGISKACRGANRRRLLDLGFVRGSRIAIDLTSPLGNPTAYVVRGTAIALRRDQARYILIYR
ncbi:DtxR family transcriptional regulator [Porphyromonas gingivalis]|uniref:metal-dependent transcriptional regulator n=1 Tax=Porphyromonas gingivalis TaxID=837 RepID=UPI001F4060C9|nr:DtxR family transcriptional regulator [Porphyromonas gingivalis]MCE8180631.1 DtxR family transcriptional regulator [Porphyromonas gingivalis]